MTTEPATSPLVEASLPPELHAAGRPERIADFLKFAAEREQIRLHRERGDAWPWTADKTMQKLKLCNVRRELDKGTTWYATNWRKPHADDPDHWFSSVVHIIVNRWQTLELIGYPAPWDSGQKFLSVAAECEERGVSFYSDAYTITVGGDFKSKKHSSKAAFQVAEILNPLWQNCEFIRPRPGDTLGGFARRLSKFKYFGDGFYRGQVCADLKYIEPLRSAPDWSTFVLPGPGSRKGLNLLFGRPARTRQSDSEWRTEFRWLFTEIAPDLEALGLGDLCAQDHQNLLCEYQKFFRFRAGEPGRFRRYSPPQSQPTPTRKKSVSRAAVGGERSVDSAPQQQRALNGAGTDSAASVSPIQLVEGANPMASEENVVPLKIVKPSFLEPFKSKRAPTIAGVETLLTALPVIRIADANDFVRVHPSAEDGWTPELCFVSVPIHGDKRDQLHLIEEDIAMMHLSAKKVKRFRLALATKPYDAAFFCIVPTQNLDNVWNATALKAIDKATTHWVQVSSRKDEGVEGYKTDLAKDADAFPLPKWTTRTLEELIKVTFSGAMIDTEDHPALRRLIGARQDLS